MQDITRFRDVVEMNWARAGDLYLLVTFSGDQYDVVRLCFRNRQSDGLTAIRLHGIADATPLQAWQSVIHDVEGVLAARVIAGEHHKIAAPSRRFAHQRAFAAVTVPAASEDRDHASAASALCQKISRHSGEVAQRIVSVRIVHDDREGLPGIHTFKTPSHA